MGIIGHPKAIDGQCVAGSTVAADRGLWTVDCGLWTTDCGLRTAHCGRQTEGCRDLAVSILSGTFRSLGFFTLVFSNFWKTNKKVPKFWSVCLFVSLLSEHTIPYHTIQPKCMDWGCKTAWWRMDCDAHGQTIPLAKRASRYYYKSRMLKLEFNDDFDLIKNAMWAVSCVDLYNWIMVYFEQTVPR